MIFGGITYYLCDNLLKEEKPIQNEDNNDDEENNNQTSENENTITSIDADTAKKLFDKIMPERAIISLIMLFLGEDNKTSWSVDEMGNNYLGILLLQNSTKLKKIEICGTEHETNLINLGVIGKREWEGQYDCENDIFYTIDSVKEAAIEVFGKVPNQLLNNSDKFSQYYYYASGNIAVFRYAGLGGGNFTIDEITLLQLNFLIILRFLMLLVIGIN